MNAKILIIAADPPQFGAYVREQHIPRFDAVYFRNRTDLMGLTPDHWRVIMLGIPLDPITFLHLAGAWGELPARRLTLHVNPMWHVTGAEQEVFDALAAQGGTTDGLLNAFSVYWAWRSR